MHVTSGSFEAEALAKGLGVVPFDRDESLSDKLSLPSSVIIRPRNESTDRIVLRVKEDFNVESPGFKDFLSEAYSKFPRL